MVSIPQCGYGEKRGRRPARIGFATRRLITYAVGPQFTSHEAEI
jgi:hypothetical protein